MTTTIVVVNTTPVSAKRSARGNVPSVELNWPQHVIKKTHFSET